ncbi:YgiQ family radical SAM protein, partial [Dehalococcoides mccartyi]
GAEESAIKRAGYLELPPFEAVEKDAHTLIDMFHDFYRNNDSLTAKGLYQKNGNRYLIQNPPSMPLTQKEMDGIYGLDFERTQHPYYQKQGAVKALETIRFSIQSHRGCYGECNFCAIAMHEGRTVQWRSPESILAEAQKLARYPDFKGYIQDIGGPTANMYGFECEKKLKEGACQDKRCLYPQVCPYLKVNHHKQLEMLKKVRSVAGVKKVFASSGIRYDLLLSDRQYGEQYLKELVQHYISGQMKVAPEHTETAVLNRMGKPGISLLLRFKELFDRMNKKFGKEQFLTYYLIAAHPGCTRSDMQKLKRFTRDNLRINPEQVQIFLPAPSTYSSLMYCTGIDPFSKKPVFVEKDPQNKDQQKNIAVAKQPPSPVPSRRPRPRRTP